MSRSTPAPAPEPERRAGDPEPLVDALGGSMTHRHDHPSTAGPVSVEDPGHHRGPRRQREMRLAAIAAVLVLVLLLVVLVL